MSKNTNSSNNLDYEAILKLLKERQFYTSPENEPKKERRRYPLVEKRVWEALPAMFEEPLKLPVSHVHYTYVDLLQYSDNVLRSLRECQRLHRAQGLGDIAYNFLVVRHEVFEGRGWNVQGEGPPDNRALRTQCLDIAFVGDYSKEDPPPKSLIAAEKFLKHGVEKKFIIPDFVLIPIKR